MIVYVIYHSLWLFGFRTFFWWRRRIYDLEQSIQLIHQMFVHQSFFIGMSLTHVLHWNIKLWVGEVYSHKNSNRRQLVLKKPLKIRFEGFEGNTE